MTVRVACPMSQRSRITPRPFVFSGKGRATHMIRNTEIMAGWCFGICSGIIRMSQEVSHEPER